MWTALNELFGKRKRDAVSKADKEASRLNYALLFSIDKRLLDNKVFQMNVEKRGNKIHIKDQRIYPFVG